MPRLEPLQVPSAALTLPSQSQSPTSLSKTMDNPVWATGKHSPTLVNRKDSGTVVNVAGNPKKAEREDEKDSIVAAGSVNAVSTNVQPQPGFMNKRIRYFDYNFHAVKKSIASGLLDVALLMANASQLRTVLVFNETKPGSVRFYTAILTLLIASIVLQLIIGIIIVLLSRININDANETKQQQAEILNNIVIISIFFLTVVNIFIAAFGISEPVET